MSGDWNRDWYGPGRDPGDSFQTPPVMPPRRAFLHPDIFVNSNPVLLLNLTAPNIPRKLGKVQILATTQPRIRGKIGPQSNDRFPLTVAGDGPMATLILRKVTSSRPRHNTPTLP